MADVVYVIGPENSQTVKIGFSNASRRRLREIQLMSPIPLSVLWSHPGRKDLEDVLHRRFWQFRTHGEWFTFPPYLAPVPTVRKAVEVFQYTVNDSGAVQPWRDAPLCDEGSREYWLNRKFRQTFGYQPFTLTEAASATGAPLLFVQEYAAKLQASGSLVGQAANRSGEEVFVMQWLEGDRHELLGPAA